MTFRYFRSEKNGQWYFQLAADNGEPIAASEGYKRKGAALHAINVITCGAKNARISEVPEPKNTYDHQS